MSDKRDFLGSAYDLDDGDKTRDFYKDWAGQYDSDMDEYGYASPGRCAAALAGAADGATGPLLDLGCGTGISGNAFHAAGFGPIDGSDFSQEMLDIAGAKALYRSLLKADLMTPLPFDDGAYPMIAAVGVFSPGHAPAETIDQVMAKLPADGLFVFTLNDHALADPTYQGRIMEQADTGQARILFREHGTHLPKIGLESTVYVLQRC